MAKKQILVVEDEADIRELIELHLIKDGHTVETTGNGTEALQLLKIKQFDLVVLDWMLPESSGIEIAREIRKFKDHSKLGILMVTAKSNETDIVAGLDSGADDYLVKPFELTVLLARVRALLRRSGARGEAKSLTIGNLRIEEETHEAFCGSEQIQLTPYEFKLLLTLALYKGRVLTREKLISEVQGEGVAVVERAIDTHVFGLRKKLGECADVIETVRGVGYRVSVKNP